MKRPAVKSSHAGLSGELENGRLMGSWPIWNAEGGSFLSNL
jgi:hypothetical protein